MKVVFTHPGSELYGSDRMAVATVKALTDAGHDVTVVIPENGPLREHFIAVRATVRVSPLPVLRKALLRPRALGGLVGRMPRTIRESRRILRTEGADLVFANTITQPWWLLAAKLSRLPSVVHVREAETEIPVIAQRILLAPLTLADLSVANSESTRDHVVSRGFRMKRKSVVIYNGKDWAPYFLTPFAGVGSRPQLVFVGRLNPRKGPDLAIRALQRLVSIGIDAYLTVVGSVFPGYEWYADELETLARDLDVRERVDFVGFQSDAAPFLERADVVIVPSRIEPFGTIAAEGMAAERPTVVSDVQGLVEIVNDPLIGRTFPVGDAQALAEVCREIIEDEALAIALARAGRSSVLKRFSVEQYAREIVGAAEGSVSGRRGRTRNELVA
jgi:glycosyltransferase involved in cell wall biosynthesis